MIPETDAAYIAGLFDGEGSIHFKRGIEKKKKHDGNGYLKVATEGKDQIHQCWDCDSEGEFYEVNDMGWINDGTSDSLH